MTDITLAGKAFRIISPLWGNPQLTDEAPSHKESIMQNFDLSFVVTFNNHNLFNKQVRWRELKRQCAQFNVCMDSDLIFMVIHALTIA